jgi:hypothetical protein
MTISSVFVCSWPAILTTNSAELNDTTVRASDAAVQTLVTQLPDGIVGLPVQRIPPSDRSSTPLLLRMRYRHTTN